MKLPPASSQKLKKRGSEGVVVVNKMFADYDKEQRDSCPGDMESYMDDEQWGRFSDATSRISSRDRDRDKVSRDRSDDRDNVQMGPMADVSTDFSRGRGAVEEDHSDVGWALM